MAELESDARYWRALSRRGEFTGPTVGLAIGQIQANLMILPGDAAFDFLLFCQRNPKSCPLLEVLEAGQYEANCAPGSDLRSDLPAYRVFRQDLGVRKMSNIQHEWEQYRELNLVSFLLGCSFSFEAALMQAGIPLRHVQEQKNVAMYRSNIRCQPAGRFSGNMVVSMRPVKCSEIARVVAISARYPRVHGAPVHIGSPAAIGITDLAKPDYGDAVHLNEDELPVFWACGVTPQYVAEMSGLAFYISHAPGHMFLTDLPIATAEG